MGRDDAFESKHAGESIEELEAQQVPPCVDEHGTVMSPFAISKLKNHPYAQTAPETHGHFADTPYTIPPYAAATVPFRWMLREQAESNKFGCANRMEELQLGYNAEREPELDFAGNWVQEGSNQRVLLDTFFSAAKPDHSLIFFYAKRTPLG